MVTLAMEASETKIATINEKQEIVWSNPALQEFIDGDDDREKKLLLSFFRLSKEEREKIQEFFEQSDDIHHKTLEMELQKKSLRTPLQGITGMTSLLLDSAPCGEQKESLTTVVGSSRWLLTLINNLLDVRKVDAQMMKEFQLSAIPLQSAVSETAQFCRPVAALCDTTVEVLNSEPTWIVSNPVRFQQVLLNLVSNVIKHTSLGTSVKILTEIISSDAVQSRPDNAFAVGLPNRRLASDSSKVAVISVLDSGPGLPAAIKDDVFEKISHFSEDDDSKYKIAQPTGTGLGLNLCLKFVDRMAVSLMSYFTFFPSWICLTRRCLSLVPPPLG